MTDESTADPGCTNQIVKFMHCGLCLKEIENGTAGHVSPEDYARFSIGLTLHGLQVWCVRHDVNVCHIDFEGQKHPANTDREVDA